MSRWLLSQLFVLLAVTTAYGNVEVVDHTYRIPNAQQKYNSKETASKRSSLIDTYMGWKASTLSEPPTATTSSKPSFVLGSSGSLFDGQLPTGEPVSSRPAVQRSSVSEKVLRNAFEKESVQAERSFIEAHTGEITSVTCPSIGECSLTFSQFTAA